MKNQTATVLMGLRRQPVWLLFASGKLLLEKGVKKRTSRKEKLQRKDEMRHNKSTLSKKIIIATEARSK